jgi:chaperonin GroES
MAEKKIKFRPLGLNVLVEPEKAETKTKSGVVLVQKDDERPQKGTIVAVGTGMRDPQSGQVITPILKNGDKVFFRKFGGNELDLDGEKYLVMTEAEILGILED